MKAHNTARMLLGVFIVSFWLTVTTQAGDVLSREEFLNRRALSGSSSGRVGTPLAAQRVGPGDFENPLIFDFTELDYGTVLGPGYPNPYDQLGVEFMGRISDTFFGDQDQLKGHHLASGYAHEPAEPYIVRVTILDLNGALRIGGYVWPDCPGGVKITAWDDNGAMIESYTFPDPTCSPQTPFVGIASTSDRVIRSIEWESVSPRSLETFPRVDHVMIDLAGNEEPPPPPPPTSPCSYTIVGDLNDDCVVNIDDIALLLENWLVDCNADPSDPACKPK